MNIYGQILEDLNGRQTRKVAHNTYLQVRGDGVIALKYHATDVVKYYADGRVVLDTGGWRTSTTKLRFNETYSRLPLRVYSDKGVWYAALNRDWDHAVPFADGLTLQLNGDGQYHVDTNTVGDDPKATQKLRRRVKAYAAAFIAEMRAGNVKAPGAGDCWFCQTREVGTNKTLGEISKDRSAESHLMAHIEEKYYVPSLLWRACEVMPCSAVMRWCVASKWQDGFDYTGRDWEWQQLTKILAKYILRQCKECTVGGGK